MMDHTTTYILDSASRILSVSGPWDEFAQENNGASVCSHDVCGRSIWDFVAGNVTSMWLDTVFQIARIRNEPVERPYRCDSPDLKRFMAMRIVPGEDGVLRVEHEVLRVEQRAIPVCIRPAQPQDAATVRLRCSFCGRVRADQGWEEPSIADAEAAQEIVVAYSLCESCFRLMPGAGAEPGSDRDETQRGCEPDGGDTTGWRGQ